jgi:hypothetical protein
VSKEQLRDWALKHNIKHTALYDLLHILRQQNEHLPKDPRTLLRTPSIISVKTIAGEFYHYFGVQSSLSNLVTHCASDKNWEDVNELTMHINIDGIPLFKSFRVTLWPILGRFIEISPLPFPIALFCGESKPKSIDEFLKDYVEEMKIGIVKLIDRDVKVNIVAVICDALKCC